MNPYQIILEPIISEKALGQRAGRCYVFKIHPDATKVDVKSAMKQIFKITPLTVNTVKVKAKNKMVGNRVGKKPSYKKAYVTLREGDKIEELDG